MPHIVLLCAAQRLIRIKLFWHVKSGLAGLYVEDITQEKQENLFFQFYSQTGEQREPEVKTPGESCPPWIY